MASLQDILSWFKKDMFPTEEQFAATFSSFRHKESKVPFTDIDGLEKRFEDVIINKVFTGYQEAVAESFREKADLDAGNLLPENVISWKAALGITNIAVLDVLDANNEVVTEGNTHSKAQIKTIVDILREQVEGSGAVIEEIRQTLQSSDIDLDELQEIVTYIKENRQEINDIKQIVIGQTTDAKVDLTDQYSDFGNPRTQKRLNGLIASAVVALQKTSMTHTINASSQFPHPFGTKNLIIQVRNSVTGKSMLCEDYATETHVQINFLEDIQQPALVLITKVNS